MPTTHSPLSDASSTTRGAVAAETQTSAGQKAPQDSGAIGTRHARVPHAQTITADSDTVAACSARVLLSGNSDFKLTSQPTIAPGIAAGQELQIVNAGSKLITLQGSALAGSTLTLRSPEVVLAPSCALTVVWDGTSWIEAHRATFGVPGEHNVADYGAVGDNSTDDTAAIQKAIDAATISGRPVTLVPGLTYKTTGELLVTGGLSVTIRGGHKYNGGIRCVAAVRSAVAVVSSCLHIFDVQIFAERIAGIGIYIDTASSSVVERCRVYQALVDGIRITNSDSVRISDTQIELCGKLYCTSHYAGPSPKNIRVPVTGTVAKTAGLSCTITGTGTSFTTLGIRKGDLISTRAIAGDGTGAGGSTAEWLIIDSVDSDTQITCANHPGSAGAASGLDYTIHVGDGYHEGPSRADNNNHEVEKLFTRNNAGYGMRIHGLYGPCVTNLQSDANGGYPVGVGVGGVVTIGATFRKCYFELNGAADNFLLGYAGDILIDQVNGTGRPVVSNPGFVWGILRGMQNATNPGRVDPLGSNEADYVPSMVVANDAYAMGTIKGHNYAQNGAGISSLTMKDNVSTAWAAISGIEPPQGGENPNAVAFHFDTWRAIQSGGAHGTAKRLARFSNGNVPKFSLGMEGDLISPSTDNSGVPGGTTISKPSGRFALAAGASSVVVTNTLVSAGTKIFVTKQSNDATATDFKVVPEAGFFTVTSNANCTAAVVFDFFLVQPE
jgi:hypothetical protein